MPVLSHNPRGKSDLAALGALPLGPFRVFCRPLTVFSASLNISPMSTRQLSIGDFAAHCLEEIQAVQSGDTVLEILSSGGKVIAVLNPAPQERNEGTLADWMGSGAGLDESTFGDADEAAGQDFWHPLTARQQAELQHAPAVTAPAALLGDGTEEEWLGFEEALESWRSEQVIRPLSAADFPHAA